MVSEEAKRLVVEHLELARYLVRVRVGRRGVRSDHLDDATQAAMLGLVEAATRWRPGEGDFVSLARMRIHGAITDWRRANNTIPMRKSHKAPARFESLEDILREEEDDDAAQRAYAHRRQRELADRWTPEDEVALADLLRSLGGRVRDFVVGRMRGLSRIEMAEAAGVTPTRISQISAEARVAIAAVVAA